MQCGMEKQHKHQLAVTEKHIQELKQNMQALMQDFDKAKDEYCGTLPKGLLVFRADDYGRFFEDSKSQMAALQAQIEKLEKEKEMELIKLVKVRRELKLLDRLREKQYKAYLDDVKKEHGRFIDSMVSYKVTVS